MAKALGIEKKITTYVARHSFSTQLKRSGASIEIIQEFLGHTTKTTTQNYLDSFDDETKKSYIDALMVYTSGRRYKNGSFSYHCQ